MDGVIVVHDPNATWAILGRWAGGDTIEHLAKWIASPSLCLAVVGGSGVPTKKSQDQCLKEAGVVLEEGTGCEFSVAQQRVALAPVEGNRFIRERCGQKNACNSMAERGWECA